MAAYDTQDWGYAEKMFRKTAFLVDSSDDVHYYLGYCLNKQGKYGESIPELKITIELNENYIEAYYALSYAYIRNREREKAHNTLLKLLEITKDPGLKDLIDDIWKK
jgi:tetratricopeptide (TPR) repeat protein